MFGWRRRGRAAGASGSQIECLSVGLARVWRRNYRSRAASSGAEWKRQPKASGRGSELERRQWASALLSQGNQICISEDRRGRRKPATLHNCKLSIHGRPSPSSGPKASLSRQAGRQAGGLAGSSCLLLRGGVEKYLLLCRCNPLRLDLWPTFTNTVSQSWLLCHLHSCHCVNLPPLDHK